jgi:hypothetical protein
MFKRLAISFCLLLAFMLLQAHNLVPHHHESQFVEKVHHHHHDGKHDHEHDEDNDHHFPFTDQTHTVDFGKSVVKPFDLKYNFEKPAPAIGSILFNSFCSSAVFDRRPRYQPPDGAAALHLIFLSHSLPLRAPPTFFA